MRAGIAALLVAVAGPPLAAQESVLLRYAPASQEVVHRLFQTHTRITLGGDSPRTRETAHLGGMTALVLARSGEGFTVHLVFDSLRSRSRLGGASWQEHATDRADSLWLQVRLDGRLDRVTLLGGSAHAGAALLAQLFTALPDLRLPERPVRAGNRWEQRIEIPVAAADDDMPPGLGRARVPARATFAVDSVVPRARDTLAFVSVEGTVADDGRVPAAEVTGTVTGTLVWSTAWHGFATAATRTRLVVPLSPPDRPGRSLVIETTVRSSVQPRP